MINFIASQSLIIASIFAFCSGLLFCNFDYLKKALYIIFAILTICFLIHIRNFVISDFSVLNVLYNSSIDKPLIYKISGAWGNHEGSYLLWCFLLSLVSVFAIKDFKKNDLAKIFLKSQILIISLQLAFLYFTSNPFLTHNITVKDGLGLNPLLQDIGLAIHPPILYLGYVSTSILFSVGCAILLKPQFKSEYIYIVTKWVKISWGFLTLGIGLGSWWAYRELGWGGYWFWDPVENSSLLPWLLVTALLHSIKILKKNKDVLKFCITLGAVAFLLSLVGTFLVRSGVLISVHSFASSPERGVFILLMILSITMAYGAIEYKSKMEKPKSVKLTFFSKDNFMISGSVFLVIMCLTVLLGTIYPFFYEYIYNQAITVGGPYYHKTFIPLTLLLLIYCFIGSAIRLKIKNMFEFIRIYKISITAMFFISASIVYYFDIEDVLSSIFILVSLGIVTVTIEHFYKFGNFENVRMTISHIGVGILSLAITLNVNLSKEKDVFIEIGNKVVIGQYQFEFIKLDYIEGVNYFAKKAQIKLSKDNKYLTDIFPEIRYYKKQKQSISESAIDSNFYRDIYLVMSEAEDNYLLLKIYYKPFMMWVWFSVILMLLGPLIIFQARKRK